VICQVADNALLIGMAKKVKMIDGYLMHDVLCEYSGVEELTPRKAA
jgi:hypothetical protein